MRYYVGLDVSLRTTHICVLNEPGDIVKQGDVSSDAKVIAAWLRGERWRFHRIGLEAGAFAIHIYHGLIKAGLPAICIEARHAHAVLKAQARNKTDRNDAHGIAEMMRGRFYKAVHVKSRDSQLGVATLTARYVLVRKAVDVESSISGILRVFGLKVPKGNRVSFDRRVRDLIRPQPEFQAIIEPLLATLVAIKAALAAVEERLITIAKHDPVCQRLMTAPGVGPIVALTYRSVIDDPGRFRSSRMVGAHLGLTPRTKQSGEVDVHGRISRWGDRSLRAALFLAGKVVLWRRTRSSRLKAWGQAVMARRGLYKARIAVARKLAGVLHRMWIDGADFDPGCAA